MKRKFDIRCYVLILPSIDSPGKPCNPTMAFLHDGYTRVCGSDYKGQNIHADITGHLTNFHVQREGAEYDEENDSIDGVHK